MTSKLASSWSFSKLWICDVPDSTSQMLGLQLHQINYCQMNSCMLQTLNELMCAYVCAVECAHMSSCVWARGQPPQALYTFYFSFFFWDWAFISIKLAKQALHILLSAFLSLGLERNAPVVGYKKQKQNTKPLSSEDPSQVLLLAKQVLHQRRLPSTPS